MDKMKFCPPLVSNEFCSVSFPYVLSCYTPGIFWDPSATIFFKKVFMNLFCFISRMTFQVYFKHIRCLAHGR